MRSILAGQNGVFRVALNEDTMRTLFAFSSTRSLVNTATQNRPVGASTGGKEKEIGSRSLVNVMDTSAWVALSLEARCNRAFGEQARRRQS